jgi:16S rRNA (guanine1207-N2)-methyltransferase
MSEQYFTEKPQSASDKKSFHYKFKSLRFSFVSDNGVFSKDGIEFGTELLLESLEIRNHTSLLDMGCGYGPIGIILSRVYEGLSVDMVELNERAVQLAKINASANGASVQVMQGNGFEGIQKRYQFIITNPPIRAGKELIFQWYSRAFELLETNGELWLVIQKKQGAPSTIKYLEEIYSSVEIVNKKKGYFIIRAIKLLDNE